MNVFLELFDPEDMLTLHIVPQLAMSLVVMAIVLIGAIILGIAFRRADPLKEPKGIVLIGVIYFNAMEDFTVSIMGEKNRGFAKYIMVLAPYILLCFLIGLTGLWNPITYVIVPFSVALVTFIMIHVQAVKTNHWGYFKRYIDPMPLFLPINLLSMWAPLLSLALRLFGNALSGFCIMSIVYFGLENLATMISGFSGAGSIWIAPIITPFLHLYFDLFSGCIQTLVFCMLTMIYIYQEQNDEDESDVIEEASYVKG
ncbi:MAG: FoF1 ATP synthase subunit a [Bacilli bacterium]